MKHWMNNQDWEDVFKANTCAKRMHVHSLILDEIRRAVAGLEELCIEHQKRISTTGRYSPRYIINFSGTTDQIMAVSKMPYEHVTMHCDEALYGERVEEFQ